MFNISLAGDHLYAHLSMVTHRLRNERTGFVFLNAQVSKKNGRYQTIVAGKKHC